MSQNRTQVLATLLYFVYLSAASWILIEQPAAWLITTLIGTYAAAHMVSGPFSFALPLILIPSMYIASWHDVAENYSDDDGTIYQAVLSPGVWALMFVTVGICELVKGLLSLKGKEGVD